MRGARAKTAQEGPGAAAVAEKAVAIEEAPALSHMGAVAEPIRKWGAGVVQKINWNR